MTPEDPSRGRYDAEWAARRQSAINLANQLGHYGNAATRLGRRLGRHGYEVDPTAGTDFSGSGFDTTQAQGLRGLLSSGSQRRRNGPIRPGQFNTLLDELKQGNVQTENKQNYEQNIAPQMDAAGNAIQGLLDKPTISATQYGQTQAQISGLIKGDLEKQLRLGGAALGIRGMDPGSASGAAVLASMRENSNANLAKALTDYGINVSDLEEKDTMQESGLLADLATRRMAAQAAINDPSKLFEISQNLTGLLESLRAQRESEAYQRAQQRGVGRDWLGTGLDFVSSLFSGGATSLLSSTPSGVSGGGTYTNDAGYQSLPTYGSGGDQSPAGYDNPYWNY
jgi:hypothetical protein